MEIDRAKPGLEGGSYHATAQHDGIAGFGGEERWLENAKGKEKVLTLGMEVKPPLYFGPRWKGRCRSRGLIRDRIPPRPPEPERPQRLPALSRLIRGTSAAQDISRANHWRMVKLLPHGLRPGQNAKSTDSETDGVDYAQLLATT